MVTALQTLLEVCRAYAGPPYIVYNTTKKVCMLVIIIIIIIKGRQCKAERESDIHPISPKTSAPQYQPIYSKKRKGKRVKTVVGIAQLRPIKKHWPCS